MSAQVTNDVKKFIKDLAVRAGHTAWQAGLAVAIVLWAGSGLSVHDLLTVDGWTKLWSLVGVGVTAAVLSAVKTVVLGALSDVEQNGVEQADADLNAAPKAVEAPVADDGPDTPEGNGDKGADFPGTPQN